MPDPTDRSAVSTTFDAAPSLVLPPTTQYLDIRGKSVAGDYGDGAYRAVATEPTHQGKILIGTQWFELMGEFVTPDQFRRTADADDSASWLRARDYMIAKSVTTLQLAPRLYDISSQSIDFHGLPVNLIGSGHSEAGIVGNINSNLAGFGQPAIGTWVRAGNVGFRALKFGNSAGAIGNGAVIDRLGFVQSHPTPTTTWAPTPYDYLIEVVNSLGGITIGEDVMFLGINKGIICDNSGRLTLNHFKGHFFTEGLYLDRAYDSTIIPKIHIWNYASGNAAVLKFCQENAKALRIFRCDGIDGGQAFILGVKIGMELNSNVNGVPTDIHFNKLWVDASKYGIYNNAPASRTTINDFVAQGEALPSGSGSAIPGSAGYYCTASAGGGLHSFGNVRVERFALAGMYNLSNSTHIITGVTRSAVHPGAPIYKVSGSAALPFFISNVRGFVDDLSGTFGTKGLDYTLPDNDQRFYFTGTTTAAGVLNFAHGLGAVGVYGLRGAFAVAKGNSGEAIPMTFDYMDGLNAGFTASQTGVRAVRAVLTIAADPQPAW